MVPDVEAVRRFRVQRIRDTVEDALVLLELRAPLIYAQHELAAAAAIIQSASDKARSVVYSDPTVAMWSLVDLSPLLEESDASAGIQLAEQLAAQIRYVSVAISVHEGRSYRAVVTSVTHLPGVKITTGLQAGETQEMHIEVNPSSGLLVNGKTPLRQPQRLLSGFVIPEGDPLLTPPALDGYEPDPLNEVTAARWAELLAKVRPLIARNDAATSLVEAFGRYLFPLKPSSNGNHLSVSFKHRPCVIYLSWSADYLEVAEAIVHESDHQCLYEVINEDPLFDDSPINFQPVFRSPWRHDPRPLSGLFFGFSAFVTVGLFWQSIACDEREPLSMSAGARAVLALDQALDAIEVTQEHASLTEKGRALLDANQTCARDALRRLELLQGYASWSAQSQGRRATDALNWQKEHRGKDMVAV